MMAILCRAAKNSLRGTVPLTMLKLYIPVITLSLFQDYRFWYDYFTIFYKVYLLLLPSTSTVQFM
jgi:hypothetical protein